MAGTGLTRAIRSFLANVLDDQCETICPRRALKLLMEPRVAEETWAFEHLSGPPAMVPAWRSRAERAAWFGAAAGLICIVPSFVVYMARYSALLPAMAWAQLLVETTSFSIFAGTVHSAAIALGLSLGTRAVPRVAGGALLGALSGALIAAIGCAHFGRKPVPYFGGGTLYATVAIGVLVFAVCHAHNETRSGSWRAAVGCTLLPLPVVLAFLALGGLLAPGVTQLDYATFKTFANTSGLAITGALGGAAGGALIGTWTATGAVLVARRSAPTLAPTASA